MIPILLDGRALAQSRAPRLAARAAAVTRKRHRPPTLLLLAFEGAGGAVPHVERKRRAAAQVGIAVTPLLLPPTTTTEQASTALRESMASSRPDAVFVQFPFPHSIDGHRLAKRIPVEVDIDVMGPRAGEAFVANAAAPPPLTVTAVLALLDAYGIDVARRSGVVVGADTPLHIMLREALRRRGAHMAPLLDPPDPALEERLQGCEVIVVAAARPHLVSSGWIAPGATLIDAGYFNPGGHGDVDPSAGLAHLGAFAPVPGGVGPMTVSALLEAVIARAESPLDGSRDEQG